MELRRSGVAVATLCALALVASAAAAGSKGKPGFINGDILSATYDGVGNDLLTGGLGKTGLASLAPPTFADPLNPTAAELRTRAIHTNYRALVDMTTGGGYGVFYGPNVTLDGQVTASEGLIAGREFLAFADDGSGRQNVTLMIQLPASFDPASPCIVTAPSSGSRGIYGAIATAGEWGLKRGCAVAYTDKGTGTGAHDLQDNTVSLITGERVDAAAADEDSHFTAKLSNSKRAQFNAQTPNRFAFKHAHSQQNPEADWGRNVLRSIEFAFYILNREFPGERFTPDDTLVIASSVSNGGGASVLAAEQDRRDLIDGVAVSEPNVNPEFDDEFAIQQGDRPPFANHSRSLYDYTTLVHLYQGCANRAADNLTAPFNFVSTTLGDDRCASLHDLGLLDAATPAEQAVEAQQIINDFGILPEQNVVQPSHWFFNVPQSISVTYANAYGRFSVAANLCGYSFGATDAAGNPIPLSAALEAALFSDSNGIPPTAGIFLINNASVGGPKRDRESISPSTNRADQNVDGAVCLRNLATGTDAVTGAKLRDPLRQQHRDVLAGIRKIRAEGDLHGIAAVIVAGRSDAILPPNHTSRAYFGLNRLQEGEGTNLRYYEVTNAQHLDSFNGLLPGFDTLFIPLHVYFNQALNLMYDHLTNGTPLPPSQVVHTVPRGVGAPPLAPANVPPIQTAPDPAARITFADDTVKIPD
jgi:hydroxybutyrate-dimer hydrolase